MAEVAKCRRIAPCRNGLHAELDKQPLKLGLCPVHELRKSTIELTEAEEGQVDSPPTKEDAQSRDTDEPAFGWNPMRTHAIADSHL